MEASETIKKQITLENNSIAAVLFGKDGANLKMVEKKLGVSINSRGSQVIIEGSAEAATIAERLIKQLYELTESGYAITPPDFDYASRILSKDKDARLKDVFTDTVFVSFRKRQITPKSITQKKYVDSMRRHDIVFGIGPAGTGKTYLAMAAAVAALTNKEVDRIILTRPAVEAGEKLGFLPGDIVAKVDPYLRPLYDALHDMLDIERVQKLTERGIIEVAPLAFMR